MRDVVDAFEEVERLVPEDEVREWLMASRIPEDERTVDVLECLTSARAVDPIRYGDDVDHALAAGYFHRASEVEGLEGYEEIPGDLHAMTISILRGYATRAEMEAHCESPEEVFGACALNLATRWSRGKSGHKWPYRAVREAWTMPGQFKSRQESNLRRAEKSVLRSKREGDWNGPIS